MKKRELAAIVDELNEDLRRVMQRVAVLEGDWAAMKTWPAATRTTNQRCTRTASATTTTT